MTNKYLAYPLHFLKLSSTCQRGFRCSSYDNRMLPVHFFLPGDSHIVDYDAANTKKMQLKVSRVCCDSARYELIRVIGNKG